MSIRHNDHIDYREMLNRLNKDGYLSGTYLMRKNKITRENAIKILEYFSENFDNVYFYGDCTVYIEGRSLPGWKSLSASIKRNICHSDIR